MRNYESQRSFRYWAYKVALLAKNPPANAGDKRDVGWITDNLSILAELCI